MKVTLNTQTKEIKNGKIEKIKGTFTADLDMSLASQIRFEAKFPELAKNEDLIGYAQRLKDTKELNAAIILSNMKVLYCWFDTDLTFIEFLKLFDLTDIEYIKQLTSEIKTVFDLILNGSAEKNFIRKLEKKG